MKERFPAGPSDRLVRPASGKPLDLGLELLAAPELSRRDRDRVRLVAIVAVQIAAAEANEDLPLSETDAFALQR